MTERRCFKTDLYKSMGGCLGGPKICSVGLDGRVPAVPRLLEHINMTRKVFSSKDDSENFQGWMPGVVRPYKT